MEFYFIRHGQSENNANALDPKYLESSDPELTEIGHAQAACLSELFEKKHTITDQGKWNIQNQYGYGFSHIYSSLMVRAVGTGIPTVRKIGMPLIAWVDIHEEGGIYSREDKNTRLGLPGKPRAYFEEKFPELQLPAQLDGSGWWNRAFEGIDDRQARADQFLADLLERHGDQVDRSQHRVAIFSHGGFFVRLMCSMLKLPWRQASNDYKSWFLLNNASISRFDFYKDELNVCYINRTDHIPDHLIT